MTQHHITQVARVDERGHVKPLVIMLDEPVHTEANGYRCDDPTCPCWADFTEVDEVQERKSNPATSGDYHERMMRASFGTQPFSLLK